MIESQNTKIVQAIAPALVDNASATGIVIDTLGFGQVDIYVRVNATDIALTALKMSECDTSGGTYIDISGSEYGGTGLPALPTGTGDDNFYGWSIRLNNGSRKRFQKIVLTAGDGTLGANVYAVAVLSRPSNGIDSATERGMASQIIVL